MAKPDAAAPIRPRFRDFQRPIELDENGDVPVPGIDREALIPLAWGGTKPGTWHPIYWAMAWVGETWVEVPVPDAPWITAYRLTSQRGRTVIAEVRVFPQEHQMKRRRPGTWSGELLGERAKVPPGGLTVKILKSVRISEPHAATGAFLRYLADKAPGLFDSGGVLDQRGITRPRGKRSGGPRGRPPKEERDLLRVAVSYVQEVGKGRGAAKRLAHRLGRSRERVREWIRLARRRGFLEPTSRGVQGAVLSTQAKDLIKSARDKARVKRDRVVKGSRNKSEEPRTRGIRRMTRGGR